MAVQLVGSVHLNDIDWDENGFDEIKIYVDNVISADRLLDVVVVGLDLQENVEPGIWAQHVTFEIDFHPFTSNTVLEDGILYMDGGNPSGPVDPRPPPP